MTGPHSCLCGRNVHRPSRPCQVMEQSAAEHSPFPRRPAGPGPRSTAQPARWSAGGDRENGTLHRLHGTPFSPAVNDHPRSFKNVLGCPSRPGQYQERPFSAKGHPTAQALLPGGQRAAPPPTLSRQPARRKESTTRTRVRVLPCCARRGQHPPAPPQVPGDRPAGALLSPTGLRLPDPTDAVATGPRPGLLPHPGRGDPIRRAPKPKPLRTHLACAACS